jgi:hypothetical protein
LLHAVFVILRSQRVTSSPAPAGRHLKALSTPATAACKLADLILPRLIVLAFNAPVIVSSNTFPSQRLAANV